jgi:hypothetical protein
LIGNGGNDVLVGNWHSIAGTIEAAPDTFQWLQRNARSNMPTAL